MRINNIGYNTSFKGNYYFTSDVHSKPVHAVGILQKISDNAKSEKSCIYLDNGDVYTDYQDLITNIYTTFAKKNPNIQSVINLGNAEGYYLVNNPKEFSQNLKKLTDSGIQIICSPFAHLQKSLNIQEDFSTIKPYVILKDTVDGEEKDILVVGSFDIRNENLLSTEKQVEILTNTINEARKKHKPYKTILLSHNNIETTKDILDQLKENGINPGLAVIIVGDDPASRVYVNNKKKACEMCGFYSVEYALDENAEEKELLEAYRKLPQNKQKALLNLIDQ